MSWAIWLICARHSVRPLCLDFRTPPEAQSLRLGNYVYAVGGPLWKAGLSHSGRGFGRQLDTYLAQRALGRNGRVPARGPLFALVPVLVRVDIMTKIAPRDRPWVDNPDYSKDDFLCDLKKATP